MKSFEIKKIVCPIDFSETSLKALNHAIDLSKAAHAEIILIHVVESILSSTDSEYYTIVRSLEYENAVTDESKQLMRNLVEEKNENGTIKMTEVVVTGKPYEEILKLSKDIHADVIVMGTHGISGLREFMMGSNTYRVVKEAECPVLSVQPQTSNIGFRKILMPFNDQPHSREKVNYAIKIASLYDATLYVLGINFENDEEDYERILLEARQIKSIAEKNGVECIINVVSESYQADPIIKHAMEINADLIVEMTGMERLSVADYFEEPLAEQMVNHSPIPVLSVKPSFNTDTVDLRFY